MRRIFLFLVVFLFGIALAAFSIAKARTETAQNQQRTISVNIPLMAQNNSNETGTATLTTMGNNQTKVVLKMNNAPSNDQPAHIHSGSCSNPGGIKYSLNPVRNGMSETTINVSMRQLVRERPLAINVHKSNSEEISYSCGNIGRSSRQSVLVDSSEMEGMQPFNYEQKYDGYGKDEMMKRMKEHKMKCECRME